VHDRIARARGLGIEFLDVELIAFAGDIVFAAQSQDVRGLLTSSFEITPGRSRKAAMTE